MRYFGTMILLLVVTAIASAQQAELNDSLQFSLKTEQIDSTQNTLNTMLSGHASYYHSKFEGRKTASGEVFRNDSLTAAHRTLPFGTLVKVCNTTDSACVIVRINDRGPYSKKFTIDLSRAAARQIGLTRNLGHMPVLMEIVATPKTEE